MAEYMILAFTNPVEGREHEYNDWYDNIAVPTYKSMPGLTHHGRYTLADAPKMFDFSKDSEWKYLSLYSFETDDLEYYMTKGTEALAKVKEYSFSETIEKTRFFEPIFMKR